MLQKARGGRPEGSIYWEGLCVWIPEPERSFSRCWAYAPEGARGSTTVSATVKPRVGGEGMSLVQAAWGNYEGPTQERWGTGQQSPKFTCTVA